MLADVRLALRMLGKTPGFALSCVLTLALGIGANSAMFSLVHRLLWNPLDLPGVDRLVTVHQTDARGQFNDELAPLTWLDLQSQATSLEKLAAFHWWSVSLTGGGEPEQVQASQVSPEFFPVLGVSPALGRTFAPDETEGKVVVLSNALWRRRFGADPNIVGRNIVLDGESRTIVGVMPDGFNFPSASEAWAPWPITAEIKSDRSSRYVDVVGRLRDGVGIEEAQSEVRLLGERMAEEYPGSYGGRRLRLVDLPRGVSEDMTHAFIYLLCGAALFVLLIACANVAGLYLARATARRKELAVRIALGAGRTRIVRQLLTETIVVGVLGGILALLFAAWVLDAVKSSIPPTTTRYISGWSRMGLNPTVLGFTFVVSIVTGAIFGLWPAIQLSRPDLLGSLQESGRATGGRHTQRARSVLVVLQAALALALLIGAGAMVKGFRGLVGGDRQFVAEGLLTLRVNLPESRYSKDADAADVHRRIVERLSSLPGVEAAAAVNNVPWGQSGWSSSAAAESNSETRADRIPTVDRRPGTPGYLPLLELPLLSGRWFGAGDTADAPPVAILTQSAARLLFPDEDALGKRLQWGAHSATRPWVTVVGVVSDLKRGRDLWLRPTAFVPLAQSPTLEVYYAIRTSADPMSLARSAREAIHAVDPRLPVMAVQTLEAVQAERLSGLRIGSQMMAGFAIIALLLAALGLYGVVAYLVSQRTQEIGIRVALGAQKIDVLGLVLRRGLILTFLGVVLGLVGAVLLINAIQASPMGAVIEGDASVFIVFTALVAAIALLGTYLPARKATQVDPMVALRRE